MADAAEMLGGLNRHVYVVLFGVAIAYATVRLRYQQIARVLKWFAVFLFAYIIVAFLVSPDWMRALHDTFIPRWPQTHDEWAMLAAILGTTISPYLFFWQSSQEVEEEKAAGQTTLVERRGCTEAELRVRRIDVGLGTFFSNLVMYFIILASAVTLHRAGLTHVETSKQAAEALRPIAGHFAALLYTLGLLGVGFLAIPTLAGSAAYALAETFHWDQGLDAPLNKARLFYAVIVVSLIFAVAFDFSDINPLKALLWSAIVNGLLAPFMLVALWLVVRDPKLMNGRPLGLVGQSVIGLTTVLMVGAAIGLFALC